MDSAPTGKMMMKKKMGPARPLKETKKRGPSSSPRRISGSPRLRGAGAAIMGGNIKRDNEYNKKFIEQLKSPSIELRQTGADVEADPTLEISLLLDCTSSMSSWIAKAKKTIIEIIDNAIKECEEDGNLKCRVSFVGYRDISDDRRFEVKPFTDNIEEVKKFIGEV